MKKPSKEELFANYNGNLKWLGRQTIYLTLHGSHAYGTNVAGSDVDFKGVCIPPKEISSGFLESFEQADGKQWGNYDGSIYSLRKFCQLASVCNPSVIEILWADPGTWIWAARKDKGYVMYWPTLGWEEIYNIRTSFLSQEALPRYSGYAISQVRHIDLHRQYLLNPPKKKPEREDFNLPGHPLIPKEQRESMEALMKKVVEGWQVDLQSVDYTHRIDLLNKLSASLADMKLTAEDQWYLASKKIGLDDQAMEYLKQERAFKNAVSEWAKYQEWKKNRNPVRAEMEAKYGYDLKMAMHTIRLQRTCSEILQGKGVKVYRPDAKELLEIRNGVWTYEQFKEEVKRLHDLNESLAKTTTLPKTADVKKINQACQRMTEAWW